MEVDTFENLPEETERNEIREKLSKMSFEELQKLKAKLGKRVYQEAVYGAKAESSQPKRRRKDQPLEVSSKIKPSNKKKKKVMEEERITDPRFNRLCGTFNEKHFRNTYEFLTEIRKKEKAKLERLLKEEKNPEEVDKIKYLIQRMENQEREGEKRRKKQEAEEREKKEKIEALKSGKMPHFRTKFEKKVIDLVDKYTELKKAGKVEKFMKRKQKKLNTKERRKFSSFDMEV